MARRWILIWFLKNIFGDEVKRTRESTKVVKYRAGFKMSIDNMLPR